MNPAFYKQEDGIWTFRNSIGNFQYYPTGTCRAYFIGDKVTIYRINEGTAFIKAVPITNLLKSLTPSDFYSSTSEFLSLTREFFRSDLITLADENGDLYNESNPISTERPEKSVIPNINIAITSGNVPHGKYAVTFITSNNFIGTILGASIPKDFILPLKTDYNARFNVVIPYTIIQGNIMIITIE